MPTAEARLLREVASELADAGLRASIAVRNLDTDRGLELAGDEEIPAASLAKIPVALAVIDRVEAGRLDGSRMLDIAPGSDTAPGLGRFRHPARISVDDLVTLALTISDSVAADALLDLVPLADVSAYLAEIGVHGIALRHAFRALWNTPLRDVPPREANLAQTLAARGSTAARGHPIPQLDVSRANTGTAIAWADLLERIWRADRIPPPVAERMRDLLGQNLLRHRLAPDFASDASRWSSKTGSVLNLRHEAGVVEHDDGTRIVVVALSTSNVPATEQPAAEAALAAAARMLHDAVR